MELLCTCGAKLPDDARFCHRCGRPLRDEYVAVEPETETVAEPAAEPVVSATAPAPDLAIQPSPVAEVSFHNGLAVRVCLLAAALVYLLMTVTARVGGSMLGFFFPLLMTALGGGYAVFLYRRRSGQPITVRSGARVGWMTGVFSFVISTVLFTVAMLAIAGDGGFGELYRQSMSGMGLPADSIAKVQALLENPTLMVILVLAGLGFQFMTMTILGSVGGALSAKLLERE